MPLARVTIIARTTSVRSSAPWWVVWRVTRLHRELLQVLERYAVARERADARVHAVDEVPTLEDPVHHVPCPPDALQGLAGDLDAGAAAGDADHLLDGEVVARERHGPLLGCESVKEYLRRLAAYYSPCPGLFERPVPD